MFESHPLSPFSRKRAFSPTGSFYTLITLKTEVGDCEHNNFILPQIRSGDYEGRK